MRNKSGEEPFLCFKTNALDRRVKNGTLALVEILLTLDVPGLVGDPLHHAATSEHVSSVTASALPFHQSCLNLFFSSSSGPNPAGILTTKIFIAHQLMTTFLSAVTTLVSLRRGRQC